MARVYYERLSDESAHHLDNESSRQREHTAMILVDSGLLGEPVQHSVDLVVDPAAVVLLSREREP